MVLGGSSRTQVMSVLGNYDFNKYINSKNMSFANAFVIRDSFKNSINKRFINGLSKEYNDDVLIDSFKSSNYVNSWISDKTLGLVNNAIDDLSSDDLLLINSLAIDMEWKNNFIPRHGTSANYLHENFSWYSYIDLVSMNFKDISDEVSGMSVIASFNNYDIVNVLGEDNIKNEVKNAFIKYLNENPWDAISFYVYDESDSLSDDELMEIYLNDYIKGINSNYNLLNKSTDFSFYVDDSVKVFAKDLKEYNGLSLQYVGIMPTRDELNSYISNVTSDDINLILNGLKDLNKSSFKEGFVTKINGFIPKFKFDYDLSLKDDLKKLGITDIFDMNKADLSGISSDDSLFINGAIHKSNIEFTQDGIKVASSTIFEGGRGAGGSFDYIYDVPIEEIDLTFDKPFMFIIRDKNSGEVWFVGTVYSPFLYKNDTSKLVK